MNAHNWSSKLVAAGIHFAISACVALLVLLAAAWLWYPGAFVFASGLLSLVGIVLLVDVVLGPLLTFVVFEKNKRSLKLDLAVVVVLQLAGLFYGMSAIYQARPVFVVFVVDRFEAVSAADLEPKLLAQANAAYRTLSLTGPRWVAVQLPTDQDEVQNLILAESLNGTGPALVPKYYAQLTPIVRAGLAKSRPLSELALHNSEAAVTELVGKLGVPPSRLRYFPLKAIDQDVSVIVSDQGEVLDVARLRPWM